MAELTSKQKEVMKWLGYGWKATTEYGGVVYCNGQKLCTLQTIEALVKKGYVEKEGQWKWKATDEGKHITGMMAL